MTEFYVVEAYQIEKYVEERNPLELFYLWNNRKPPPHISNPKVLGRLGGHRGKNTKWFKIVRMTKMVKSPLSPLGTRRSSSQKLKAKMGMTPPKFQ
jgi:hypothetical protein